MRNFFPIPLLVLALATVGCGPSAPQRADNGDNENGTPSGPAVDPAARKLVLGLREVLATGSMDLADITDAMTPDAKVVVSWSVQNQAPQLRELTPEAWAGQTFRMMFTLPAGLRMDLDGEVAWETAADGMITAEWKRCLRSTDGNGDEDKWIAIVATLARQADGWKITRLIETWRDATPADREARAAWCRSQPYDPRRGLGERYLGGGTAALEVDISDDGSRVVFSALRKPADGGTETGDIALYTTADRTTRLLTKDAHWCVSPTFLPGGQVRYLTDRDDDAGTWFVCDADGRDSHPVVAGELAGPRGRRLLITRSDRRSTVQLIGADGRPGEALLQDERTVADARLTSAGLTVLLHWKGEDGMLCCGVFRQSNGKLTELTQGDPGFLQRFLLVDGDRVWLCRANSETYADEAWALDEHGKLAPIAPLAGWEVMAATYAGGWLYFVEDGGGQRTYRYDLYRWKPDSDDAPNPVTHFAGHIHDFAVTPDGHWIALIAEGAGARSQGSGASVYRMRGDGSDMIRLSPVTVDIR